MPASLDMFETMEVTFFLYVCPKFVFSYEYKIVVITIKLFMFCVGYSCPDVVSKLL